MQQINRAVAIGTAIMLLAGCSLISGGVSASLDGEWQLQAGTNQGQPIPIVPGSQPTLRVDGTQVGGSAACNSYGGKVQVDSTKVKITELFQTEMACLDDRLMASEAAYVAALSTITSALRNGNGLVMTGPQVELRFVLIPPVADANLVGTVWVLDSLISGDAVPSTVASGQLCSSTPMPPSPDRPAARNQRPLHDLWQRGAGDARSVRHDRMR